MIMMWEEAVLLITGHSVSATAFQEEKADIILWWFDVLLLLIPILCFLGILIGVVLTVWSHYLSLISIIFVPVFFLFCEIVCGILAV